MSDENGVVLGKRKQRDDSLDERSHGASGTLFVSNLPYTATSTDLQTLFSDFAPVRTAFVVLENGVSKGVGYVSFAIKGDAETAMETIEKDGVTLDGRKLRVTWAQHKPRDATKDKSLTKDVQASPEHNATVKRAPRPSVGKVIKDPDAIRTVIISGLPPSVDQKTLWKKIRKCPGAERVEIIESSGNVAHAIFTTPANAVHAVEKLHAHVFKGALLSAALKKRLESLEKAPVPVKEKGGEIDGNVASSAAPSRGSRLIVRNVPWNITETDLRALFLPFGPIYSITIPVEKPMTMVSGETTAADTKPKPKKPRAKGFAFVWFFSKKDAERAISGVNGRAVRAGAVVAPTMNKKERARLRRRLRSGEGEADEDEDAADGEKDSGERIVAVDWALSKEKWEEAKAKGLLEAQGSADEGGDDETASSNSNSAESQNDETDSSTIVNDDEEDESGIENNGDEVSEIERDSSENERSDVEEATKPILPQTDVGTTLFIRNLPFDATEDELRILFRTFGPLRYARITVDTETGRSRGTGFVCFWNKSDADKALEQSELLAREAGLDDASSTKKAKKNPFTLPSLLTPDPSSSLAQPLVLHGRTLALARAVPRDAAARLAEANLRAREKADKRNLYLLREGLPLGKGASASASASALGTAELEKRQASFDARQRMLKRNLALYVSRTRLSIRGLPLFVSERALKRLAVHAIQEFEAEVARDERSGLNEDELRANDDGTVEANADADSDVEDTSKKDSKTRGKGKIKGKKNAATALVAQAKIVRDSGRADALTRAKGGRSKGYGFLELRTHADALRVLRWANANAQVGPLLESWWAEELEGHIKALEDRQNKKKEKETPAKVGKEEEEDGEARLKRLRQELEKITAGRGKKTNKTLLIEFSIENAQVVGRRKEKIEASRVKGPRGKRGLNDEETGEHSPSKRRKVDKHTKGAEPTSSPQRRRLQKQATKMDATEPGDDSVVGSTPPSAKANNKLGSLIGRKRKQRRMNAKAT